MRKVVQGFAASLVLMLLFYAEAPARAEILSNTSDGEVVARDRSRVHAQRAERAPSTVKARKPARTNHAPSTARSNGSLSPTELTAAHNRAALKQQARIRAAIESYTARLNSANACLQAGSGKGRCRLPSAPELGVQVATATLLPGQAQNDAVDPNTPPPVVLTPQQVAYIAFARLHLTAPTPGIGPPPSINEWKMAAVGYPLWLWGEGDIDPAPVSDSVGGLSVSLEAHVSKIVFDMGEGSKVTCRGRGQKWTRSVPPGQKSPVCGHVYAEPSLPRGPYKITATTHWAVAWTVTGQRGVIPFVQVASAALPVGELQVLVR